ncbi:uncharacterized protein BKA55DRAFT_507188, partial [Fusarium redolens]
IRNLSWNTTDDSLRTRFSDYGNILDSAIMRDRDTGRSRGFGFVTFSSSTKASNAIGAMNEQNIDGNQVKVNMASARPTGNSGGGYGGGGYGKGYGQGGYSGGYSNGGYGGGGSI